MKIVRIQTTHCLLRNLEQRDTPSIATLANNPAIFANVRDYFPFPYELRHAIDFVQMEQFRTLPMNLAIEVDGEAVGVIGIQPLKDVYRYSADFGYWLGQPYWGKGIMTSAAKAMVRYVFENFPITRLQSSVFEYNIASMQVLEKAGFLPECIAQQAVYKNGKHYNEHRFYLLQSQWMQQ